MSDTPETDAVYNEKWTDGDAATLASLMIDQAEKLERQLNKLRSKFTKLDRPKYSGKPMMDDVLKESNPEFNKWVASLPDTYWLRYDLSAARIGWEGASKTKEI